MEKQIITRSIKCLKCKYEWMTRTQKRYVSCPNCLQKVKSDLKNRTEVKGFEPFPGNNQEFQKEVENNGNTRHTKS